MTHNPQDAKKQKKKDPGLEKCSPSILSKAYFGQFKGYTLCSGNVGGFFASEDGSCHRGFTIVLNKLLPWKFQSQSKSDQKATLAAYAQSDPTSDPKSNLLTRTAQIRQAQSTRTARSDPRNSLTKVRESETTIKIKFAFFRGGGGVGRGAERKIVQSAIFHGNVMTIKF